MKRFYYILFSPHGDFYYFNKRLALAGQKIHGGYVSRKRLYHDQVLEAEL